MKRIASAALPTAIRLINHLIADEDWARERLRPFAGQRARVELGLLALPLVVGADGLFVVERQDQSEAAEAVPPEVTITLAADAPLRALTGSSSLLAAAKISGAADFAEALAFVFRNLSWDAENDLAFFVGDIAARRLVAGGKDLLAWQREQARNLALNIAEYLTEEQPAIASARRVSAFCAEVGAAAAATAKLEQRIGRLEALPRPPATGDQQIS